MHDLVAASADGIRRSLETLWFAQYMGRWRSRGRPGPQRAPARRVDIQCGFAQVGQPRRPISKTGSRGVETHVSRARALRVLSG